jgi:PAS domain S-box-containing protein
MSKKPATERRGAARRQAQEDVALGSAQSGSLPADAEAAQIQHELQVHQVEVALQKEDLDIIFNLSQDIIILATMNGRFIRLNPAFERLLGHTREDLKKRGFLDFVHPDDRKSTRQAMAELKAGRCVLDLVNRYHSQDGSYRWLEWRVTPYRGDFICALARDITARKQVEESLQIAQNELEERVQHRTAQLQERTIQLRALASTLILAEERERTRIARLVHDHLQQMLVAALLNIRMLKSKDDHEALAADFDNLDNLLKDAIETTHTLTAELSPAVLHQCGLAAALKWLRPWCLKKFGLEVEVETEQDLDPGLEISVTLFLCVRELLFNVVKHAGVNSAALRLWRAGRGGVMKIEVSDQGLGFDPAAVRISDNPTGGIGLFHIRERMELLGGGLETESSPGHGSRFTLWVPLSPAPPALESLPAIAADDDPHAAMIRAATVDLRHNSLSHTHSGDSSGSRE